ncbi:MAG TPA: response regulator transcription factor [Patescibacteria group bacterium]|nr:response regulator transcription factor [Patescibacteria group bacterium]
MRILLAEDDAALASRLIPLLQAAGFTVDHCSEGRAAEFAGQTEAFDAVVLDLGLPGLDGLSVLDRWRAAGLKLPVLILTARTRWHDKLAGFSAGADDFLTKPFQPEELILRLHALIRRSAGHAHPVLRVGPLSYDAHSGRFAVDDATLSLTAHESRVLAYLMHHAGRVVGRGELGEHVYDQGIDPDSNAIDVVIGRIRRKLGIDLIHTERGRGFRLEAAA